MPVHDHSRLLYNAVVALDAGRFERAIQICSVGLNRNCEPEVQTKLRLMRAEAEISTDAWAGAQKDCERLLELGPSAQAFALLARSLFEQGRQTEAQHAIESALAKESSTLGHVRLYTEILLRSGQHEAAVRACKQACALDSSLATIKLLLRALAAAGKQTELIATLERLVPPGTRDADIWCTLGDAHNSLGQDELAVAAFTHALGLDPGRGDAHCGLGYAFLRQGNYAQGFLHHEHRQGTSGLVSRLGVPSWQGESLASKHLLVWTEQAMGDMIQFARYVPLASRLAESVTFKVPKVLIRVFSSNREMGRLTSEHPGFGAADVQALVMSLPHRLGLGDDVGAATVPYLWPETELVQRWKARLPQGRLIALSWQGNPAFAGEPWRSIPLERLAPVVAHHKRVFRFLSLQKNHGREQLGSIGFGRDIIDLGDEIDNEGDAFVDSLAILASVELLLTTDTSLAHLAGAANIPTWLMLPFACVWRWGNGDSSTIWYPSTRIFRQRSPGDWSSVINDVLSALSERH